MDACFAVGRKLGKVDASLAGFSPSVDGSILPQHPFDPAAAVSAEVPVMIGYTRTEWTGMTTDAALWLLDEGGMRTQVKEMLGEPSTEMIGLHRKLNPGETPSELLFLIASDYRYGAPTLKVAERRAALHKGPVYLYYFV